MTSSPQPVSRTIAGELGVRENQVTAAIDLLDGGATVPFIARYRKEVTGALDDTQLRNLEERLRYLRELDERRAVILESIRSQGRLDEAEQVFAGALDVLRDNNAWGVAQTLYGVGRLAAAILENFQQADGSVNVPKALVPYFGAEKL